MTVSIPQNTDAQDLIFKTVGDRAIELTYLPPTKKVYPLAPIYFEITGGGWHSGSRKNMLDFAYCSAEFLRSHGWAVVSTDYRMTECDPGVTIDDEISDVMDALRYLAKFSEPLQVDPHKIVVTGHSAGGHLAMMAAYSPPALFCRDSVFTEIFTVVGCIPYSGISMLYPDDKLPNPMQFDADYIYPNGEYDAQIAHRCSPYDYICGQSTPTLFFCGSKDPLVHPDNSILAYEKGKMAGAEFELIVTQNGGHCLESVADGEPVYPAMPTTQWIVLAWIAKNIGI